MIKEIQHKMNGLSSKTRVSEEQYPYGGGKREVHLHPETGEVIILITHQEYSGDADDPQTEYVSEVVEVYPSYKKYIARNGSDQNFLNEISH